MDAMKRDAEHKTHCMTYFSVRLYKENKIVLYSFLWVADQMPGATMDTPMAPPLSDRPSRYEYKPFFTVYDINRICSKV